MHINTKITTRIALAFFLCLGLSTISRSQILISLLLGDKLNTGQIEFGLTGGYNRSQILQEPRVKHLNVFYLGFYFDFLLKKNWYLYTGVHVKARMGASSIPVYSLDDPDLDTVFYGESINRKISYFNVPIEIKYRFKNNIYVDAGFQLGLRYRAFDEFINSINTVDDLIYKQDIRDEICRLDAGVSGGLGYKMFKGLGMNFGLRYYYGLVDIYKDASLRGTNSALYIFAEIPIGAGKKDKKEIK